MSAQNKIDLTTSSSAFVMAGSETARCAIDGNGMIIYANDAFCSLSGLDLDQDNEALDIFTFSQDDLSRGEEISDLEDGDYDVHIGGSPLLQEFHFSWLDAPDNKKILIASIIENTLESEEDHNSIDALLEQIHTSASRINTQPIQDNAERQADAAPLTSVDYAAFMSMSQDIMLLIDTQGHILHAHQGPHQIFDPSAISNTSFLDLFNEEERPFIRSTIQGLVHESERHAIQFETQLRTKNGALLWIEWQQKYADGQIYVTGRDITDVKRKKEDLKRRQKQLSEAEAIGRMGHWHWLIGEEDISWSEEIYRIFGVDQTQFTPTMHSLTDLVHKRDLSRVIQVFQRAIIEEKDYDMEFRVTRPGGDVRFIMCEGRCEKNDDGEVIALYGIMQDMTERMLYEQELRAAKDASEQAYIAKSRFLANMSHELRTPLNAIIGFSEMIESQMLGPIFNEKYIEYGRSIKDSGEHLLSLINDILDMSKIEAGKHSLELEEVNLQNVINRATQMVQGHAQDKKVSLLTHNIENADLSFVGDRRALTQVILNVLSNAVKFTPEGGKIWLECLPRENYFTLRICDTGIGIPPNKLANVLKPFEQASNEYTRDHEGTGLGLSISKELIELHHGSMNIESTVNVGTTVTLRLPYDMSKKPN